MVAIMNKWQAITVIANDVQAGKTSARDLVEQSLAIIDAKKDYKALIAICRERALERAKDIDDRIKNNQKIGRLAGIPFIAKDNFLAFGAKTTAASNILKNFEAPYQATAIERLEAEGAICVAKANMDAFAHGSSTENSDFFTTLNPNDKTRVPGGSSGGSATAVILDMVPFALGTDTGGSIRLPASFCGAVGYKPTYGLVSRSGVIAMASSTDVVGPLARTVADVALILDVMSGRDPLDSTSVEKDAKGYQLQTANYKPQTAIIGVVKEYMDKNVDNGVKEQINYAIDKLAKTGAKIKEISLPSLPLALAAYYIICPAEISSNLNRYDGQRFGFSYKNATNLDDSYKKSRSIGFGAEAKRRIMIGTYVLSSGYYDAYYKKAQTVRTKLIHEFNKVFEEVDFLIGPTAPTTAFKIGENSKQPLKMYLTDIMTVASNLAGIPAISIPAGTNQKLPIGLQIMAPQKHDKQLLELANVAEGLLK